MVNENTCNGIAITALLKRDHLSIAKQIENACLDTGVQCSIIQNTNDYWCRDFMPLQINTKKYVQFTYDPSYYKHKQFTHLKTNVESINFKFKGEVQLSDIVLDGGNLCYCDDVAIITDKIFKDNNRYTKDHVVKEIYQLLELKDLLIIPALPYDITGHADGMVKFIDKTTLLLSDFRLISGKTYWNKLLKSLSNFQLVLLPNDLHLNLRMDDATGDYINMVAIKDRLLIPAYNKPTDKLARTIIEKALPDYTVIPVLANDLAAKAGILHCATWNYFTAQ